MLRPDGTPRVGSLNEAVRRARERGVRPSSVFRIHAAEFHVAPKDKPTLDAVLVVIAILALLAYMALGATPATTPDGPFPAVPPPVVRLVPDLGVAPEATTAATSLVEPLPRVSTAAARASGATPRAGRPALEVEEMVRAAARLAGVDEHLMVRVAFCESSFRPDAVGAAGERGIFQFMPRTWAANAPRYGFSADFDEAFQPDANVLVAAAMFAAGKGHLWTCT